MNRVKLLTVIAFSVFIAGQCFCARQRPPAVSRIDIVRDGKKDSAVASFIRNGIVYINAKAAAENFSGHSSWYGESRKLVISARGFRAVFREGEKTAETSAGIIKLEGSAFVHGEDFFVPVSFFGLEEFCNAVDKDVVYNEENNALEISRRYNVGKMDYYAGPGVSRVSFLLREKYAYFYEEKNRHITIRIPDARAAVKERVDFKDGLINSARVGQVAGNTIITVLLGRDAENWDLNLDGDTLIIEASSSKAAISAPPEPEEQLAAEPSISARTTPVRIPDAISAKKKGKRLIVIDPGHGGHDPGGRTRFLAEKDSNLAIAKHLVRYIKMDGRFQPILTRDRDEFIQIGRRAAIANENNADMFISIHANAARGRKQNGFEVFFMSDNASDPWAEKVAMTENIYAGKNGSSKVSTAEMLLHSMARSEYYNDSSKLAGFLTKNMDNDLPMRNRGIKQGAFYVLRGTYCPSVLVETGFVTNPTEARYLSSRRGQVKIAESLFKGIKNYAKSKGW